MQKKRSISILEKLPYIYKISFVDTSYLSIHETFLLLQHYWPKLKTKYS